MTEISWKFTLMDSTYSDIYYMLWLIPYDHLACNRMILSRISPIWRNASISKKSVMEVAPVFLKTPRRRIEAIMFLYFITLMLVSLIERKIRLEMQDQEIESLSMRPAGMHTKKPAWRIRGHLSQSPSGEH